MDFWREEFDIYKNFNSSKSYPGNKLRQEYNERPFKKKKYLKGCWCKSPHIIDVTKKTKYRFLNYLYYGDEIKKNICLHLKELRKSKIHKYRKELLRQRL